jgi:hypothetical protein
MTIYRQKNTGDLYVIDQGEGGRMVDLEGQRQMTLHPPHLVLDADDKPMSRPYGHYETLRADYALWLVVERERFKSEFEKVVGLRHVHNEPIEALLQKYEEEFCDFSNLKYLVTASLRYSSTMEDCQVRCLLYSLAKEMEKRLPPEPEKSDSAA